jgi:hypothetical protein
MIVILLHLIYLRLIKVLHALRFIYQVHFASHCIAPLPIINQSSIGGTLQPINPNKTQVTAIFNVDLKLRVVPTCKSVHQCCITSYFDIIIAYRVALCCIAYHYIALINFFTKKLAHFGFKLFRRQCAQIAGSPYMTRIQSNRCDHHRTHYPLSMNANNADKWMHQFYLLTAIIYILCYHQ